MDIKKIAAIDVGSNSVRLLIMNVLLDEEKPIFKKSSLIRVPVRLGASAFTNHTINDVSIEHLTETMLAFRHLMKVNDVVYYKGCATAALREAKNGEEVVKRLAKVTGINIDIIQGDMEAHFIFNAQKALVEKMQNNCLFVDVGGGSTEITFFLRGETVAAKSFSIGTIRLLQDQVTKKKWEKMKEWVKTRSGSLDHFKMLGSGGNINRIAKLTRLKPGKPLPLKKLKGIVKDLKDLPYDERLKYYDLNPDRADVIIPAGEIFLRIMKWVGAEEILIPKIGLGDGIAREAYKEYISGRKVNQK